MGETQHLSLFGLIFLSSIAATHIIFVSSQSSNLGGFSPIVDIQDPHIQELGHFAVSEFNKDAANLANGLNLTFVRVVSGEKQVVSGTKYRLVIEAEQGASKNQYLAVIWEKVWENFRQLVSFESKP